MVDESAEFQRRVLDEYLPAYLADTGYPPGGYRSTEAKVPGVDAKWFLRAVDTGLVEILPKALLHLPASHLNSMIFWELDKNVSPRPISLYVEGIVSAATAARLHFEFGWPKEALGFESPGAPGSSGNAFDLFGLIPGRQDEYLAGEAKSNKSGLDTPIADIHRCASRGEHDDCEHVGGHVTNSHRKWRRLVRSRAPVLFVFGPGKDWTIYRVTYESEANLRFDEADEELLGFLSREIA